MGLRVDKITLSGFGSYNIEQTVELGGRGPVAVTGDNGAGKSTAVSKALTWCLYGKCPPERMGSGMRSIAGKAVLNPDSKAASVTVETSDQESGEAYKFRRTRNSKGGDVLTVMQRKGKKWATIDEASQATIDELVGANFDVFVRTVVRGQGNLWSFSEATDKGKRAILDAISGAEELEGKHVQAIMRRKAAEARTAQLGAVLDGLERRVNSLQIESSEKSEKDWREKIGRDLVIAGGDLEAIKKELKRLNNEREESGTKSRSYDALQKQKPTIDYDPYETAISEASGALSSVEVVWGGSAKTVGQLASLKVGDACPTCHQKVKKDAPIVEELSTARRELRKAETERGKAQAHMVGCQDAIQGAREWYEGEVSAWQKKLDDHGHIQDFSGQIDAMLRAKREADERIKVIKEHPNPHAVAIDLMKKEKAATDKEIALTAALVEASRRDGKMASSWEEALSPKGARAHMAESVLSAIEDAANEWLGYLSDGLMRVEFPATKEVKGEIREEIRTVIWSRDGGEETSRDLLTYSGGERRRINLAVDLGVARTLSKGSQILSLLVLDEEVFSGLDENGKSAVVHSLHNAGVADVVIVDHDPRLSSTLPRALKVYRDPKDGYSRIEEVQNG